MLQADRIDYTPDMDLTIRTKNFCRYTMQIPQKEAPLVLASTSRRTSFTDGPLTFNWMAS